MSDISKYNIVPSDNQNFNFIVIKPCSIQHLDWSDTSYPSIIGNLSAYNIVNGTSKTFVDLLVEHLKLSSFEIDNFEVKNQAIAETTEYVYELLYLDFRHNKTYCTEDNINEIANLLNLNTDKIYHNAILLKNFLSVDNNLVRLSTINTTDIIEILFNRVNINIVTWDWDSEWKEFKHYGDLNMYANIFFEGRNYKQIELGFLKYNINIWYIEDSSGESDICGNLLSRPIERCIWFTLLTDDIKGNISLDEVNKIIKLSKKIDDYKVPSEFIEDETNEDNTFKIYTKYRILHTMYSKYCTC